MHEAVLDQVLQILPKFFAVHVPTAPLAPVRGATFHPLEEKAGAGFAAGSSPVTVAKGLVRCSANAVSSAAGSTGLAVTQPSSV